MDVMCQSMEIRICEHTMRVRISTIFPHLSGKGQILCQLASSSSSSARPQLQALDRSVLRRTRTASPRSERSLPDLNCKLGIAAVPAGPEQQAQDQSGPCRTPTDNCKRQIAAVPAGPEQQPLDQSDPGRTSTASARSQWSLRGPNSQIAVVPAAPEQQPLDQSYPRRSSTVRSVSARSQWSLPDPNSNLWIKVIPAGLRPDVLI